MVNSLENIADIEEIETQKEKGPRKRSWTKKKKDLGQLDAKVLRSKLIKISNFEFEDEEPKNVCEDDLAPVTEALQEIKGQFEKNKNATDEQFERAHKEIREVQATVDTVSREVSRIFTQFIFTIQGLFFCFIFGLILFGIGLKRQSSSLAVW